MIILKNLDNIRKILTQVFTEDGYKLSKSNESEDNYIQVLAEKKNKSKTKNRAIIITVTEEEECVK